MTKDEALAFLESMDASDAIKDPLSVLDALKSTREEAKANREKAESMTEELNSAKEFRTKFKGTAIKRELAATGIKNGERIAKLINMENVDINDEGDVTGLDEQLELVKTDFPEIFEPKRRAPSVDQFVSGEEINPKLSATQQQIAQIHARNAR